MPKAPRYCPGDDGRCRTLITTQRHCPEHTPPAWQGRTTGQGSTRAGREARLKCLNDAGHQCQLRYQGCIGHASIADHVTNIASTNTPRAHATDQPLQAACAWCHSIKTRAEATAARGAGLVGPHR